MPVSAIIQPDEIYAGGVVLGGRIYRVRHNQLTGNPQGKREKLAIALQEALDGDHLNVQDLAVTYPDDPDFVNQANSIRWDNEPEGSRPYLTVTDAFGISDDGTTVTVTVRHKHFYWDEGPSKFWLIHRNIYCSATLTVPNDPTLGNNDRYVLSFTRT